MQSDHRFGPPNSRARHLRSLALAVASGALVLGGCHKTMVRSGATTERVAETRQWFLFGGLAGVSNPTGYDCANGLSFSESKYGAGDWFLSAGLSALAVLVYSQTLQHNEPFNVDRAANIATVVPWLLSSRSVRYGCATAPAPRYRRARTYQQPTRRAAPRNVNAPRAVPEVVTNTCPGTAACTQLGRCQLVAGRCRAVTDQDCAGSVTCRKLKRCRAERGTCVAGAARGVPAGGVKTGRDRCRGKAACTERGLCLMLQGKCVAPDSKSCRAAAVCRLLGKCVAKGGRCVVGGKGKSRQTPQSADPCRGSKQCKDEGRCRTLEGTCVAAKSSDCKSAAVCRILGKCRARHGRCVAK